MKFAPKLTALFVSIIAIIVAVMFTVAYFQVAKILESEIGASMESRVIFTMDALDRFLSRSLNDIKIIAGDPVISSENATAEEITEELIFYRNTYKWYVSLSFFNLERIRIADTSGLNIGEQNQMTRYFEDVLAGQVSAASDVHISEALKVPVAYFASAVKNKEDKVIGVVVARILTSRLFEMIKGSARIQEEEEEEEEIDLINKDGLLIYSNHNRGGILKENLPEWESIKIAQREKIFGSAKHRHPGEKEVMLHAFCRERGYLDFKGNGWTIISNVPTRVIFGPVNKLLKILIIMFLVMVPVLALVIYLFSKTVTRPLTRLSFAAAEIGKGKLDTVIEVKSKDEFGSLANTFSQMAADLKKTTTSIDSLNKEITERKKAEEAMRESEEQYKNLFKANIDGILIADVTTKKFRYANPAICRMLGYSEEEFTQMGVADIHPKESLEQVFAEFEAQVSGAKINAKDLPCVRKDGQVISVSINAGTVTIGQTEYVMGIFRDITERKQMEENLRLSKTQAEAANEAKSRFLANMSHEIRTPLNSIIGFSEILMQEELAEEHKEHLRIVYNSGKHLLHLIGDILDFSRIEAGKMNIEMEQCSLGQLIAKIESMMQLFAAEKGLTFEIREKGDLPANIATDTVHLQQCLINLVNNAIKFTEQGHIYVNISLEDKDSKPRIRFEVEDTGTGIAPESQQKIFEPFVQEDGSTSRKYGGTGLGLTITRKLAELLGGELTLTSEKGKGSVFSLVIPAGVDLATQPLLERQKISDDTSTDMSEAKHARFSGCALVAEDVKSNQMFMKALLERMGLKITIAENGAEAVDKALSQKFDLIFMDIQMPQVNGYEATRILRSKGIKTPIVALTAGAMEGDDKKCIEAGCDDYLSKPIEHSKLIEALSKYLENDALPKDGDFTVKSDNDKVNENYLSQMDAPDNEEVIDWAQMVAHGLDEQSMKEIIPTYVNDNKEHLRGLISAVKTSNAKDVQSHAHAIKGAGRNLGVARLSELAGQLETMALKEDLSEAEELLKDITSEFHRLEEFISRPDWIETAKEQATNRLELGSNRKSS